MRVLFIGDVFGDAGRRVLAEHLGEVQRKYAVDFTIANGENCAGGRGITIPMAKKMRKYGVDVITGGNHSTAHLEVYDDVKLSEVVLRPHNMAKLSSGKGYTLIELPHGQKIAVINVMGKTFMKTKVRCPFKTIDALLEEITPQTALVFVDFHAEVTSEKICLAHYFDGRVSAIVGTHTHVQTADERILPKGTAFLSDAGMTGAEYSAIGMEHEPIIERMIHGTKQAFSQAKSDPMINGVVIDIDTRTGKAVSIERVFNRYQFEKEE